VVCKTFFIQTGVTSPAMLKLCVSVTFDVLCCICDGYLGCYARTVIDGKIIVHNHIFKSASFLENKTCSRVTLRTESKIVVLSKRSW
jgi:hypothetical protein